MYHGVPSSQSVTNPDHPIENDKGDDAGGHPKLSHPDEPVKVGVVCSFMTFVECFDGKGLSKRIGGKFRTTTDEGLRV